MDRGNGVVVHPVGLESVPVGPLIDEGRAADAVGELLAALSIPVDEHTSDTPRRVAHRFAEAVRGYQVDPLRHLEVTFPIPAEVVEPGIVIVGGIRVVSTCAHHLLPIVGQATVAYRPARGGRIVGLSKLARVVEEYAARLQVQEQLTGQIAEAVHDGLDVVGSGCIITAEHGCMTVRGVAQPGALTTTAAFRGDWSIGNLNADRAAVWAQHRERST
jgi:GTP cyclohydrolase I